MTGTVEIAHDDARPALTQWRKRRPVATKVALPIVDVEAVLERVVVAPELVAAADDVQVRMSVAIRVEEHRVDVLRDAVRGKHALVARPKMSVGLLDQQLPWLAPGPADVDVIQPVAVHVADGERRSFTREQLRHQGLADEVDEAVLHVPVRNRERVGHVLEQWGLPSPSRRLSARAGVATRRAVLRERERSIHGK